MRRKIGTVTGAAIVGVLLLLAGAWVGQRLGRAGEDGVWAEIRAHQHELDRAVRGAVENRLEEVSDLLLAWVDPRIRLEKRGK